MHFTEKETAQVNNVRGKNNNSILSKSRLFFIHIWIPPRCLRGWSKSLISRAKAIWNSKKKKKRKEEEEIPHRNIPIYRCNTPVQRWLKLTRFFNTKKKTWIKSTIWSKSFNCMHVMLEWFSFVSCFAP